MNWFFCMLKKILGNLLIICFFAILYSLGVNVSFQTFISEFSTIILVLIFLIILTVGSNLMLDFLFEIEKQEKYFRDIGKRIDKLCKQKLIKFEKVMQILATIYFTIFYYLVIPFVITLVARTSFQNENITGYLPLLILGLIFSYRLFHTIDKKISDEIKSNIVSLVIIGYIIVAIAGQRPIENDTIYYSIAVIFSPLDYYFVHERLGAKLWDSLKGILKKTFQKNNS